MNKYKYAIIINDYNSSNKYGAQYSTTMADLSTDGIRKLLPVPYRILFQSVQNIQFKRKQCLADL